MSQDIFLVPGLRTPFVKAGGVFADKDSLTLSAEIIRAMVAALDRSDRPDFVAWGQVIPDLSLSNISRELIFEAGLDPKTPAFSTVLACSTSMVAAIQAGAMVGKGGTHLALVGGVETMSRMPVGLTNEAAARLAAIAKTDPARLDDALAALKLDDFTLKTAGLNNRVSGRSMGDHTEETAKAYEIAREDQDRIALLSHQNAASGQEDGFFDELIVPVGDVTGDTIVRRDTSAEKLAELKPVFDPVSGSLTAGNSSPLTDGAAGLWVADGKGLERLGGAAPVARLVDWRMASVDFLEEGMLMAPAWAIPQLIAAHGLRFDDIDLWEVHEAFAAQVLANIKAASDPAFRKEKVGLDVGLGEFPWDRLNPNGGSLAIGHPFAATGARILSQAVKELAARPKGAKALVSVCADGGQGTVALLERA